MIYKCNAYFRQSQDLDEFIQLKKSYWCNKGFFDLFIWGND